MSTGDVLALTFAGEIVVALVAIAVVLRMFPKWRP